MSRRVRRLSLLIGVALILFFAVVRCTPEKSVDFSEKTIPIEWLSEDELLVRTGNNYFIRDVNGALKPSELHPFYPLKSWGPQVETTPSANNPVWSEKVFSGEMHLRTDDYLEIAGEKHRVKRPWMGGRQRGMNQGFPSRGYIDFLTYLHLGKVGLLTFNNGTVQKVELPQEHVNNLSAPIVTADSVSRTLFAFQSRCVTEKNNKATCLRMAWWLSEDMEVKSSFLLPRDDLLFTKEKLSCFSCGCGCYTQEDVYAVGGKAYFHVSGFPLATSKRGLYKVVFDGSGEAKWQQEIKGRIESPLAFSPSGCKVAYFQVSRFGDSLEVKDLCS